MAKDPHPAQAVSNAKTNQARPAGPIRMTIPAALAYDLPRFQQGIASALGKLGCPNCCSGRDITFATEREFVLNEQMELHALSGTLASEQAPHLAAPTITVTLPTSVSDNVQKIQEVVAKVAGRIGCAQCHSGFDLRFRQELEYIVDEKLNVHPAAQAY